MKDWQFMILLIMEIIILGCMLLWTARIYRALHVLE
jgi:hypothetical protein